MKECGQPLYLWQPDQRSDCTGSVCRTRQVCKWKGKSRPALQGKKRTGGLGAGRARKEGEESNSVNPCLKRTSTT